MDQKKRMRILITNDDGYDAEGIRLLTTWTRRRFPDAYLVLVAPLQQQSGKSHAVNIRSSFKVETIAYPGVDVALAIDSTPADCVRFAHCFHKPFDLVLSGVNQGYNLGFDIGYSGTCAAVFEAGYLKYKAVAFSTDFPHFKGVEAYLDTLWDFFEENKLLEKGNLWNVNFPLEPNGKIRFTRQGEAYFLDYFVPDGDGFYHATGCPSTDMQDPSADSSLDTVAVCRDHQISITPFTCRNVDEVFWKNLVGPEESGGEKALLFTG